ncbi:MAG: hypothetical protein JST58_11640 [Bacteroidetes bacterium]|nr:hypothetical protein [Bacteroidota bacterium]
MRPRFNGRKFLFFLPLIILGIAAFGGVVMLLWNHVLAVVLPIHTVNFWQALGILALSKILFGGFRGGHFGRHPWKQKMQQRWESMTPEEREKFKQEWGNRCGGRRFGKTFEEKSQEGQP